MSFSGLPFRAGSRQPPVSPQRVRGHAERTIEHAREIEEAISSKKVLAGPVEQVWSWDNWGKSPVQHQLYRWRCWVETLRRGGHGQGHVVAI